MRRVIFIIVMLCINLISRSQNFERTISMQKGITDYSSVMSKVIEEFFNSERSKGIIYIESGTYPFRTNASFEYHGRQHKELSIIGKTNSSGGRPLIDASMNPKPINIIGFTGTIGNPTNLSVRISNLSIKGNNRPYAKNHPFFGAKEQPHTAISILNVRTFSIENIEINNFYGNGIVADNYYDNNHDKKFMINAPVIRNFRFYNSWSENHQNNSSMGIRIGYAKSPLVENCFIENNLLYSRYPGFVGIDLETRTEKAILRNNSIKGFKVAIWNECDYGGHLMEKNKISQTYVGVTLSQDCNQDIKRRNLYFPSIIRNNSFEYGHEYDIINQIPTDWGFISIGKESFMLEGLTIENNTFSVVNKVKAPGPLQANAGRTFNNSKLFIDIKGQKKVTIRNNTFK